MSRPPTAAINYVPIELLAHIFQYCVQVSPSSPLLLSRVSSRWHTAALAFPQLWTHLHINASDVSIHPIRKAQIWVGRSGVCPLDVSIDAPHATASDRIRDCLPALADILDEDFQRIRKLSLVGFAPALVELFFSHFKSHTAPSLERFAINVSPSTRYPSPSPAQLNDLWVLQSAPRLKSVRLGNVILPPDWLVPGDLRGLTSLQLSRAITAPPTTLARWLHILRDSPALEQLHLEARILEEPTLEIPKQPLVHLPRLKEARLVVNNVHGVLSALDAPALESLSIVDLDGAHSWVAIALDALIRNSSPRIHALAIENSRGMDEGLLNACLTRCSASLTELRFKMCFISDRIARSLQSLPRLRRVVFDHCHRVEGETLVMIASRTSIVEAINCERVTADQLAVIQALNENVQKEV